MPGVLGSLGLTSFFGLGSFLGLGSFGGFGALGVLGFGGARLLFLGVGAPGSGVFGVDPSSTGGPGVGGCKKKSSVIKISTYIWLHLCRRDEEHSLYKFNKKLSQINPC